MTQTMNCLQLDRSTGDLSVTERDVPEVGPTDVLVDVEATGVGLTVANKIRMLRSERPDALPVTPGHELVGTVAKTGGAVSHLAAGDLVTAHFYLFCGHCRMCLTEREPFCENVRGQVGVETDGGYAEFAQIPARNAVRIPDGLDPVDATVVPDAVATPYHICRDRVDLSPDDRLMVLGAGGGVGIHLLQLAGAFGADVTAVDLDEEKLERCVDLGASDAINTSERSVAEAVDESGRRYDYVVDFTGADTLVAESLDALTVGGRYVNMTTQLDDPIDVSPSRLVREGIEVVGSRYCSRHELSRAAELVASGTVEPVVSEVVELADVPDLLARIADGTVLGRGAVTV